MKIYFVRHGESQANRLHEISNRGLKHPLTEAGRQQARDLAGKLQGEAIAHIYSSPVLRAIETTVIVAHALGIEYDVTEALREFDVGFLEGRADEEAWRAWQGLFDDWTKAGRREQRIEGGESLDQVQGRLVSFVDGLIQQYGRTSANLLCVAHGGLYSVALPAVITNVDRALIAQHHGFDYASVIVSELQPEGLVAIEWNGAKIDPRAVAAPT